ncbi:MAG: Tm-1-like ATP-binding domain-containing protein [bacterium]|nr:Tm-1-like ATP-binding domain-containing protein [Acidimicrobiia bacterium]MCY4651175.1 Tm-1-like ATP-binding domain-containing protein [bacterium]
MSRVVVAGTFDTKTGPLGLLVETLTAMGSSPITIDTGVFSGDHGCHYHADAVAEAGGHSRRGLASTGRAEAVSAMARGAAIILRRLVEDGQVGALVCLGGSSAAVLFTHLAPVVPFGIPKILMATSVAGETRPLVDGRDVTMIYPIVDIEGDNTILRAMIGRLARVAVALLRSGPLRDPEDSVNSVGLTMYGLTNPCVTQCRSLLSAAGLESVVFHANGTGGRSFESFISQGLVSSVIDVTISEITDELCGGLWPAGPQRLRTASRVGAPQVVAPGAIDMICLGPLATLPEEFRNRTFQAHNELVTLVQTTAEENYRMGETVVERLGYPRTAASVLVPMKGFSGLDIENGPFHDPEAVEAFVEGVRSWRAPNVSVVEVDYHINQPEFAEALVDALTSSIPTSS